MDTVATNAALALAAHLGCEADELTEERNDHYGLTVYSYGRAEYAVGNNDEADAAAASNIADAVWAFNAEFILSECELPGELADAIRSYQEDKCESANDALTALIDKTCGMVAFTEAAVRADGRGHFLSSYDGEENEETVYGETIYIYRIN
jgi:hypothetical protein